MRDCFRRELHLQKQTKSGEPGAKRRKYMLFEQMLFLIPQHKIVPPLRTIHQLQSAMEKKTLMKDRRMKVQMMVQPKLTCVERKRAKGIPRER